MSKDILRQRNRFGEILGIFNKISYRDIKDVYTIVLFEKSPAEFHGYPYTYLHYFEQCSDTGLELDLLQKYFFIPLDIFRKNLHNKVVENKLDAWLMFLCVDEPEDIIRLIETYPEFGQMYQEAYAMCRNLEEIMGFFSEELRELDRNTVQLMIDEMQEELDKKRDESKETNRLLNEQCKIMMELREMLVEKDSILAELKKLLAEKDDILAELNKRLAEKDHLLIEMNKTFDELNKRLAEKDNLLSEQQKMISEMNDRFEKQQNLLEELKQQIAKLEKQN